MVKFMMVLLLCVAIIAVGFILYEELQDWIAKRRKKKELEDNCLKVSRYCDLSNVPIFVELKAKDMLKHDYPLRKVYGYLQDESIRVLLSRKKEIASLEKEYQKKLGTKRTMSDYIILIVGKSGSGKSMLCRYMRETYGLKEVKSYTTRQRRNVFDDAHIFVSEKKFNELENMCAVTNYNGELYGATREQIDEADLYVIDVDGVEYLLKHYDGKKIPMVIYIDANEDIREERMLLRGDPQWKVNDRLMYDAKAFKNIKDYTVETYVNNNDSMSKIKDIAREIYGKYFEKEE